MPDAKRVLLIDDDDFVRNTICEVIEGFGYEVTAARSGDEAFEIMAGEILPHVVVTDIVMPGISGLDVIAHLRKSFPEVKIVAISGGGAKGTDNLAEAKLLGSDWILPKPVDMKELEIVLRRLAG